MKTFDPIGPLSWKPGSDQGKGRRFVPKFFVGLVSTWKSVPDPFPRVERAPALNRHAHASGLCYRASHGKS